jgi:hypothetical protein
VERRLLVLPPEECGTFVTSSYLLSLQCGSLPEDYAYVRLLVRLRAGMFVVLFDSILASQVPSSSGDILSIVE